MTFFGSRVYYAIATQATPQVSVLIACYNSQRTIRRSLESARWADEILVIDSHSSDDTLKICAEFGARVLQYDCSVPNRKKAWGIPHCSHQWVLILDTDEQLEPGLQAELQERLRQEDGYVDGYRLARKNLVYGRWLRHGENYPDYQLRLFKKEKGRYEDREVHANLVVPGAVGTLRGHLIHNGFKDLSAWLPKLDHYAGLERDELVKRRRPFSATRLMWYPTAVFLKRYLLALGFLDGYPGFLVATLDALYFFVANAKHYETETLGLGGRQMGVEAAQPKL